MFNAQEAIIRLLIGGGYARIYWVIALGLIGTGFYPFCPAIAAALLDTDFVNNSPSLVAICNFFIENEELFIASGEEVGFSRIFAFILLASIVLKAQAIQQGRLAGQPFELMTQAIKNPPKIRTRTEGERHLETSQRETLVVDKHADVNNVQKGLDASNRLLNVASSKLQDDPNMTAVLGSIAHVPFLFNIGMGLSNRANLAYRCWDRKSSKWRNPALNIINRPMPISHQVLISENNISEKITDVGLVIQVTYKADTERFIKQTGSQITYVVKCGEQLVGSLFCERQQKALIAYVVDDLYGNRIKLEYPNLKRLHITILAQASFVMRLASNFQQMHMPEILRVYHHDVSKGYEWAIDFYPCKDFEPKLIYFNG